MSGDDAAGLAVANRYRSDVAIIGQGIRNANDGLSELQIKDGALNNISNLLDRLATLATQSASGLTTTAQRTILDAEATDLLAEIDREAEIAGLDADAGVNFSVFVSNDSGNETISSSSAINDVDTNGLGINTLDLVDRRPTRRRRSRTSPRPSRPSAPFRARSVRCRTGSSSR